MALCRHAKAEGRMASVRFVNRFPTRAGLAGNDGGARGSLGMTEVRGARWEGRWCEGLAGKDGGARGPLGRTEVRGARWEERGEGSSDVPILGDQSFIGYESAYP